MSHHAAEVPGATLRRVDVSHVTDLAGLWAALDSFAPPGATFAHNRDALADAILGGLGTNPGDRFEFTGVNHSRLPRADWLRVLEVFRRRGVPVRLSPTPS